MYRVIELLFMAVGGFALGFSLEHYGLPIEAIVVLFVFFTMSCVGYAMTSYRLGKY